ncbi:hypothetical protein GCM10009665_01370 [Kitasatospora nipponensis]|uniref:Uncharacterized protein n=1 Tax=Kitasatospora nipponensis TaxID=258049 RepID=A0ABN1VML9_9ACTN
MRSQEPFYGQDLPGRQRAAPVFTREEDGPCELMDHPCEFHGSGIEDMCVALTRARGSGPGTVAQKGRSSPGCDDRTGSDASTDGVLGTELADDMRVVFGGFLACRNWGLQQLQGNWSLPRPGPGRDGPAQAARRPFGRAQAASA